MRIKEQDDQHMVIVPPYSWWELLIPISIFGICPIVAVQFFFPFPWNIVLALVFAVFIVRWVVFAYFKIVVDKVTQTITVRQPVYWLISRQRHIPFSAVASVYMGSKLGRDKREQWWVAFDVTNGGRVKFGQMRKEEDAQYLAEQIGNLVGLELSERIEE